SPRRADAVLSPPRTPLAEDLTVRRLALLGLVAICLAPAALRGDAHEQTVQRGEATARLRLATPASRAEQTQGRLAIRLSEWIRLDVEVEGRAPLELESFSPITDAKGWTVRPLRAEDPRASAAGRVRHRRSYLLEPERTGDVPVQVAPLRYRL